jgi:DNA invertase Pin-like site-specific DNA recombinase
MIYGYARVSTDAQGLSSQLAQGQRLAGQFIESVETLELVVRI